MSASEWTATSQISFMQKTSAPLSVSSFIEEIKIELNDLNLWFKYYDLQQDNTSKSLDKISMILGFLDVSRFKIISHM